VFKLKNDSVLFRMREALTRDEGGLPFRLFVVGVVVFLTGLVVYALANPTPPFVFPMPPDVCIVDGTPRIISQNTADKSQTYLRSDGATVKQMYDRSSLSGRIWEDSVEIYFGGLCPISDKETQSR
jgi:predicted membrane channel-forming protein YqfA (hemolysin III family)